MGAAAIPYVMMAVAVAGTAVGVYSANQQGQAAKEARDRAAAQARLAAKQKAEDAKKQHERILATQRARYGASGFELTGSPLLVQMESMKESEEELKRIYEAGEMGFEAETTMGKQAQTSGYYNAISGVVSGARTIDKIGRDYSDTFSWWKSE